jgi:RNA polymerase sigma factor (sigma-70 family)
MQDYTDKELLSLFNTPDRKNQAFNLIVKKYQERLYWHIRRLVINHEDADDLLQDTFLKAWNGLARFRGESRIYTWLYRIATNESLSFLNDKRKKFFLPFVDVEKGMGSNLESDAYFNGDELQLRLQKAILTLPAKQRIVFNMRYYDEMKYEEMAEILNTSVGALKASYHHAVKKIENIMKDD